MSAEIIDGNAYAKCMKESLIAELGQAFAVGLVTVMVGDSFAAGAYERRLRLLSMELGVAYMSRQLAATASQSELFEVIAELNESPGVTGISVLRPLPDHIDESEVFRAIAPLKDIEAVHPENAGLLALGVPRFVPSTAASVFGLLDYWLDARGDDRDAFYRRCLIVVVGRSNNVGKPAVSLAYQRQAAVQSVDEWASRTGKLGAYTRAADVLIVATGRPRLVKAEHVSPHTVVVDVGINAHTGTGGRTMIVGDVDYSSVAPRARAITPVPGGVGPVTDAWLMRNTVLAARLQAGARADDLALPALDGPILEAL